VICNNNIFAQPEAFDVNHNKINTSRNKVNSLNKINQNWELLFGYDMEQFTSGGNAGVVYLPDYEEIWTSKWSSNVITIWFFYGDTLIFVKDTTIAGVDSVRGMTYDGIYIYAGDNSNSILILDPYSLELVSTIKTSQKVRYITFDPSADNDNGGFWIGNFTTDPTLIDRDGNVIRSISYSSLDVTGIYGAAYDFYSSDGPFLWFWGQGLSYGWPQVITQVDPITGMPTGEQYDVQSDEVIGQDSCLAAGLFITDSFYSDKIVLGGVLQGRSGPDILFGYDVSGTNIIIIFAPTVTTNSATNITENSATINGTINPNGSLSTVVFEYGTTTSYGNQITAVQSPVTGSQDVSVTANLTDLQPNTTYHYRLKGTNDGGVSLGSDITFTTSTSTANTPIVTTSSATNVTENTATLNGVVNPNGDTTTVIFEYGPTISYGSEITATQSPVLGSTDIVVNANLTGLTSNTTYHYRVKGSNSGGVSRGSDKTFTTSSAASNVPSATTYSATNITGNSATLNGLVNSNNYTTTVTFEYGTTTSYGNEIAAEQNPITGTANVNVTANLTGLQSNTTHHYRIKAVNSNGTTTGENQSFTTGDSPPNRSFKYFCKFCHA
ncbi:MAG: fibronectin type III domain-containing protein, partial [Ignavibacteriaceae bacterium]